MASTTASPTVTTPIPIFKVANHYMLYDVDAVTFLRREHNICGVLAGTLPQAAQQNVFLGLPLELMPEEALLLVEKQIAYIVDDLIQHKSSFLHSGLPAAERQAFQSALRTQGLAAANDASKRSEDRKAAALKKLGAANTDNWNDIPDDMFGSSSRGERRPKPKRVTSRAALSESASSSAPSSVPPTPPPEPHGFTPTTSHPPLPRPTPPRSTSSAASTPPPASSASSGSLLPTPPPSYPLFKALHAAGYFLSPGLRFGCQYAAYPGDPLRYHSHFLCNGLGWEEEFDLLELVGGGRLGTGVKKGYLIGGEQPAKGGTEEGKVRAFCVEWAGM